MCVGGYGYGHLYSDLHHQSAVLVLSDFGCASQRVCRGKRGKGGGGRGVRDGKSVGGSGLTRRRVEEGKDDGMLMDASF